MAIESVAIIYYASIKFLLLFAKRALFALPFIKWAWKPWITNLYMINMKNTSAQISVYLGIAFIKIRISFLEYQSECPVEVLQKIIQNRVMVETMRFKNNFSSLEFLLKKSFKHESTGQKMEWHWYPKLLYFQPSDVNDMISHDKTSNLGHFDGKFES